MESIVKGITVNVWTMAVYLSLPLCHLPACHLAAVISHSFIWLVWHISLLLSSSKPPKQGSCLRSQRTGVWRLELFAEVRLWSQYTLVEETIYIDMFKSCMLRLNLWFRTADVSITCLCLSLVLSVNSSNATSLHSCCMWEGVLRV